MFLFLEVIARKMFLPAVEYSTVKDLFQSVKHLHKQINKLKTGDIRESSFNMTWRGDEEIEGGLRKFLDTRRGALKKFGGLRIFVNFKPKRRGGS